MTLIDHMHLISITASPEGGSQRPLISCYINFFLNAIEAQLVNYFENIFNPFLAAFHSGFGCQYTLLRVIEDWRHALGKNEYLAALLNNYKVGLKMTLIDHMHLISITTSHEGGSQRLLISP
jgi:hypothetical protein